MLHPSRMISVQKLYKSYGAVEALRDVSFEVQKGEVVGFLGPNGAGKTTALRIVAGFLGATQGRVLIDGFDVVQHPFEARSRIGYMPENVPLYPELRVREYLAFRAELKGVRRSARPEAVLQAMRSVRVDDHADVLIGNLSKGYRQRVGLADALVANPPVLVLDEPTAGLDPNQIRDVRELVRSLAEQHTILLSTHILPEVEATCDRALVLGKGRLLAQGTLDELRELRQTSSTRIVLRGESDRAVEILQALPEVERVKRKGEEKQGVVTVEVTWKQQSAQDKQPIERAIADLVAAGLGVREVVARKDPLEQIFSYLTEHEPSESKGSATKEEAS